MSFQLPPPVKEIMIKSALDLLRPQPTDTDEPPPPLSPVPEEKENQ